VVACGQLGVLLILIQGWFPQQRKLPDGDLGSAMDQIQVNLTEPFFDVIII
jgi:hypothetical protein